MGTSQPTSAYPINEAVLFLRHNLSDAILNLIPDFSHIVTTFLEICVHRFLVSVGFVVVDTESIEFPRKQTSVTDDVAVNVAIIRRVILSNAQTNQRVLVVNINSKRVE